MAYYVMLVVDVFAYYVIIQSVGYILYSWQVVQVVWQIGAASLGISGDHKA